MNLQADLSELWLAICQENEDAFEVLHETLYPQLHGYLLRIVGEEEAADDIVQELFVKVWNKRGQIGAIRNVRAYFFTAARSIALNYLRRLNYQAQAIERFDMRDMHISCEDAMIANEHSDEVKARIMQALSKLSARQREIIYLRFYEEIDYQKIVAITGIKYQSVVNHVFKALTILRKELSDEGCERLLA